jgi:integrase
LRRIPLRHSPVSGCLSLSRNPEYSTASAATWGSDPSPIFRSRTRADGRQSTGSYATTGIDPLDAKGAQRQAQRLTVAKGRTFRECAAKFIERNRVGWRNAKHRQQWENTLATYVCPTFGELPVSAIDTGLVVQVLDSDLGREAGNREPGARPDRGGARCRYGAGLSARAEPGNVERQSRPYPISWPPNQSCPRARPKPRRCAPLSRPQIRALVRPCRSGPAGRQGTLACRQRAEPHGTVPAPKMKGGREHRVPLSDAALAVLEKARPLALMKDDAGPGCTGVPRPAARPT